MLVTQPVFLDSFPAAERARVWAQALDSVGMRGETGTRDVEAFGSLDRRRSPSGTGAVLMRAGAQEISGTDPDVVVIGFVHYGRGHLSAGGRRVFEFADGDIWVADGNTGWATRLSNDFEMLLLTLPRDHLASRLGRSAAIPAAVLGETVTAAAARPVMRTLAVNFGALSSGDLVSTEIAITELVLAALLTEARPEDDSATQVQAAHFRRVCAAIEARLGDPKLSVGDIAGQEALSPRYVQKLFEGGDRSFSDYVRHRRLERCRLDLVNPLHADQSIGEIGFRWGFADQAHFSRIFSGAYGLSPRDYRKSAPSDDVRWTRGRPTHVSQRPAQPSTPARGAAQAPGATLADTIVTSGASADGVLRLPVSPKTVHWGYLGRSLSPAIRVGSGATVEVETLTQHAYDDYERMIQGDEGAQSVFAWTSDFKAVDRRGAGPVNGSIFGRGAGEGFGVHICTGPIYVNDAEPGDVLEVQILDIRPRPSANPAHAGYAFGSNVAAAWGYHHDDILDGPREREIVTVYRTDAQGKTGFAEAVYSFRWEPQTDPFGVVHATIDYPGVPVDHAKIVERHGVLKGARIPTRPHFGFIAVAPREADIVDSVPPGYFGGNFDNWRAGSGTSVYLPVAVRGALLSIGDPHLAQGDGELSGTALECSLTADIRLVLHKKGDPGSAHTEGLSGPLLETEDAWILHGFSYPNYLRELGRNAQSDVFKKSSLSRALKSAFRAARRFLMDTYGLDEDEAISLISVGVDFGVTQVVDGNWGVHAIIRKEIFAAAGTTR